MLKSKIFEWTIFKQIKLQSKKFDQTLKTGMREQATKQAIKKPKSSCLGFFMRSLLINYLEYGVPTGIRTPVTAVKGRCPRPLDDRDNVEVIF